MKTANLSFLTLFALLCLSCGFRPTLPVKSDPIVGEWSEIDDPDCVREFKSSGSYSLRRDGETRHAKWERMDGGHIKLTAIICQEEEVKVTGDLLESKNSDGTWTKYRRIK